MKHIVADIRPFAPSQEIMVYVDGACVEQAHVQMDDVVNVIYGLKNKYDISIIDFCGNPSFLSKFTAELNTRFSNEELEIRITPR